MESKEISRTKTRPISRQMNLLKAMFVLKYESSNRYVFLVPFVGKPQRFFGVTGRL